MLYSPAKRVENSNWNSQQILQANHVLDVEISAYFIIFLFFSA